MGTFIRGDVVVVPFPFSDLSNSKKRPAIVLANLEGDDLILGQITSQNVFDSYSVNLESSDFSEGNLNNKSNVRPNKIFTADKNIINYKIGKLKDQKINEIINNVVEILTS